jgi:hypothetical protein
MADRAMFADLAMQHVRSLHSAWTEQAYHRLRRIKTTTDPDDMIRSNHPIPPAPWPARDSGVPTLMPGGPPVAETARELATSSIVRPVKNGPWDRARDCSVRDEPYEVLRTHAAKAEQDDRSAAESLNALRKDGVFALRTPRDHGGAWAGGEAIAECLAGLARSCPSTAWDRRDERDREELHRQVFRRLAARCLRRPGRAVLRIGFPPRPRRARA